MQGVDKIMETITKLGTELHLATLKEFQLAILIVILPFVYTQ
jgi:hypothetical protein